MDAIELIRSDHRTVDGLFRRLEAAPDESSRLDVAHDLIHELSVHAAIEEQLLYPVARDRSGDDEMVDLAIEEHGRLKQVLADLDGASPTDERFLAGFLLAKQLVEEHVEEEETVLLPALEHKATAQELEELGQAMEIAKRVAPTRPHPHSPTTPPGNIVVGPVIAAVDKVRDAARAALQR